MMRTNWFLPVLAGLALLSSTGCRTLIARHFIPGEPFDPQRAPPPPDYGQQSAWAALPDRADKADLYPEGVEPEHQATAAVDTFFIHPTTYYSGANWNQPLDDARANAITDNLVLAGQASVFNAASRVYAPRYRQATLGSYFKDSPDSRRAFELAYQDVSQAFRYYLEHYNQGRPFIIASHSQGSMHAIRLLEEIDAAPARERLVAAYVVGYRLPEDKFGGSYRHLQPCQGPADTGCVVSWDTWQEGAQVRPSDQTRQWYGDKLERMDARRPHCTNPLTWTTGESAAGPEANLGALPARRGGDEPSGRQILFGSGPLHIDVRSLGAVVPRATGARCEAGVLRAAPDAALGYRGVSFEPGNYHLLDYSLFYANVRRNAVERAASYLRAHPPG